MTSKNARLQSFLTERLSAPSTNESLRLGSFMTALSEWNSVMQSERGRLNTEFWTLVSEGDTKQHMRRIFNERCSKLASLLQKLTSSPYAHRHIQPQAIDQISDHMQWMQETLKAFNEQVKSKLESALEDANAHQWKSEEDLTPEERAFDRVLTYWQDIDMETRSYAELMEGALETFKEKYCARRPKVGL